MLNTSNKGLSKCFNMTECIKKNCKFVQLNKVTVEKFII